ncbi:MAG: hypothetical protein FWD61_18700 [Phycisphaerales bacterium]|nr:hypothetical protein [Phycisphaerales bacterium]
MFHSKRTILLGIVIAIATSPWDCQAADPIKVSLTTTAIPAGVFYRSPLFRAVGEKEFRLSEANPTEKFSLGGIECTLRIGKESKPARGDATPYRYYELFLKTPTQEFTFDNSSNLAGRKPVELTLDHGRKYFLSGSDFYYAAADRKFSGTGCRLYFRSAQTGKIGLPPHETPIALIDSNLDGFYTTSEDCIAIGSAENADGSPKNYPLVQPFSKYITTHDGIFELQNVAKDGSELTLLPYTGPTATIEINAPQKYSGQIILTSFDAGLNATVKPGESITVIPGSYTVMGAVLDSQRVVSDELSDMELKIMRQMQAYEASRKGTPMQQELTQKLQMVVSGEGMSPLKLQDGEKKVLVLNGPKTLAFQATLVNGKVNIKPETIQFKGQAGETYKQLDFDTRLPSEVHLTVDGKTILLGKMAFG